MAYRGRRNVISSASKRNIGGDERGGRWVSVGKSAENVLHIEEGKQCVTDV